MRLRTINPSRVFYGNVLMVVSLSIILGIVLNEYKTCQRLNLPYDWEYGNCKRVYHE